MIDNSGAFSRLELLIGEQGIELLSTAKILLCGIGGVGSWTAEMLIRAGVGNLTIVDFDTIEISNLNRQLPALHSTLGQKKLDCLKERLLDIAPEAKITCIDRKITSENCATFLSSDDWDYVIDAIDDRKAKLALIKYCVENSIAIISSMGSGNRLSASQVAISDISETFSCPLAKILRKELKKNGISSGVKVVYSSELPVLSEPSVESHTSRACKSAKRPLGTISYMPALFGLRCAAFVLEDLLSAIEFRRKGD